MLKRVIYSKEKSYASFIKELKDQFGTKGFSGEVQSSYQDNYTGIVEETMPEEFTYATGILLDSAENKVLNGKLDSYDNGRIDTCISDMSTGMSFMGVGHAKYCLPENWQGSYQANLFEYAFLGLLFLREEVASRFEKAYEVWRNSCSYGVNKCERTGLEYGVWYFTSFDSFFFAVNPFKGLVLRSERKASKPISRLKITEQGDSIWVEDIKSGLRLASIDKDTLQLHPFHPMEDVSYDRKKSEKEKRIAEGKKQKNTHWLTVSLGKFNEHNSYMTVHSLICLLVYGLEIMGPAIMDANSIFTVDHINSQHDDNRIENLQLVSRKNNNNKKASSMQLFDYFCYFNKQAQPSAVVEEIKEEKCEKNSFSPIDFSVFTRIEPIQNPEPLKTFVIQDFDDDFEENEDEDEELIKKLERKAGIYR